MISRRAGCGVPSGAVGRRDLARVAASAHLFGAATALPGLQRLLRSSGQRASAILGVPRARTERAERLSLRLASRRRLAAANSSYLSLARTFFSVMDDLGVYTQTTMQVRVQFPGAASSIGRGCSDEACLRPACCLVALSLDGRFQSLNDRIKKGIVKATMQVAQRVVLLACGCLLNTATSSAAGRRPIFASARQQLLPSLLSVRCFFSCFFYNHTA